MSDRRIGTVNGMERQDMDKHGVDKRPDDLEVIDFTEEERTQDGHPDRNKTKRKKSDIITSAIFLVGIGLVIFAGIRLYGIFSDYHKSNKIYNTLEEDFVTVLPTEETVSTEDSQKEELPWYQYADVDLEGVQQTNPDVVGWILFENEKISYPVLYSGDNDTYLRTAIDKSYATAGSIFMEGANTPDFADSHTIIYGHNMKNLSMFGRLKYYKDEGYYDDHMYFQIFTNDAIYRYQIFAYSDVPEDSSIYRVPFAPGDEFTQFINDLYRSSYVDSGVTVTDDDKIITLSTCAATGYRFVVHAVRVDTYKYGTNSISAE